MMARISFGARSTCWKTDAVKPRDHRATCRIGQAKGRQQRRNPECTGDHYPQRPRRARHDRPEELRRRQPQALD
jgi:hypothetical protein